MHGVAGKRAGRSASCRRNGSRTPMGRDTSCEIAQIRFLMAGHRVYTILGGDSRDGASGVKRTAVASEPRLGGAKA